MIFGKNQRQVLRACYTLQCYVDRSPFLGDRSLGGSIVKCRESITINLNNYISFDCIIHTHTHNYIYIYIYIIYKWFIFFSRALHLLVNGLLNGAL
jgi:hypothetical protein